MLQRRICSSTPHSSFPLPALRSLNTYIASGTPHSSFPLPALRSLHTYIDSGLLVRLRTFPRFLECGDVVLLDDTCSASLAVPAGRFLDAPKDVAPNCREILLAEIVRPQSRVVTGTTSNRLAVPQHVEDFVELFPRSD